MSARLVILNDEFFADFGSSAAAMQFSGDNHVAKARLWELAPKGFPQNWCDLLCWPMQCECGHVMEFGILYHATYMKCSMCQVDVGSPDLFRDLTNKLVDLLRYHVFVVSLRDSETMTGEGAEKAMCALVRFVDDVESTSETVVDLEVDDRYRGRK